jgi:hypothetical protein
MKCGEKRDMWSQEQAGEKCGQMLRTLRCKGIEDIDYYERFFMKSV